MRPGDVYSRPDGAAVRVDFVTADEIYFVSWGPDQDTGHPKRMSVEDFEMAIKREKMHRAIEGKRRGE